MDKKKLAKYKEKLLSVKAEILQEHDQELPVAQERGDLADLAEIVIENELLNKLSDLEVEKLRLIDHALEKIEQGSYGVCEGSGKNIPEARLNAIPWTPYTVEYAQKLEEQKKESIR